MSLYNQYVSCVLYILRVSPLESQGGSNGYITVFFMFRIFRFPHFFNCKIFIFIWSTRGNTTLKLCMYIYVCSVLDLARITVLPSISILMQ